MEAINTADNNQTKDTPLPSEFIQKALLQLPERAREIMKKRYGLGGAKKETLEEIGQAFKITRERVRQIEKEAFKKMREGNSADIANFGALFSDIINQNGGVLENNFFLAEAIRLAGKNHIIQDIDREKANLTLIFLLWGKMKSRRRDKKFKSFFYASEEALFALESAIEKTSVFLKSQNRGMAEEELFAKMNEAGFGRQNVAPRAFGSYIRISQEISQNPFGQWGLAQWPHILPRNIRDKAYLVARSKKSPVHFREMARLIAEVWKKWEKPVLAETVHNELIKDKRFILVGRGIYALAEWGYQKGTVNDIIKNVLTRANRPMSREEIIHAVSSQRLVKPSTIILNLKNGEFFEKAEGGMYRLKVKSL